MYHVQYLVIVALKMEVVVIMKTTNVMLVDIFPLKVLSGVKSENESSVTVATSGFM